MRTCFVWFVKKRDWTLLPPEKLMKLMPWGLLHTDKFSLIIHGIFATTYFRSFSSPSCGWQLWELKGSTTFATDTYWILYYDEKWFPKIEIGYTSEISVIGGSIQGGLGTSPVRFLSFSCSCWKKFLPYNRFLSQTQGLVPCGKSWIRHCIEFYLTTNNDSQNWNRLQIWHTLTKSP